MSYGTIQAEKMTTESGYSLGAGNASSFKNRIINGGMNFDQRSSGASVTISSGASMTLDRWKVWNGNPTTGVITVTQSTDAPTGFTNSLSIAVTTAQSSIGATYYGMAWQQIEGNNCYDLLWGTANAKSVTLSFWVKSNLTGTFTGALTNNAGASYTFEYTINASATWEYKTVTVPGATSGTWNTNTSSSIIPTFAYAMGANNAIAAGSWNYSSYAYGTSNQTNLLASTSNYLRISGVQLEVGTVATSFDFRSVGTELALCQRYYQSLRTYCGIVATTAEMFCLITFPVQMRTTPAVVTTYDGGYNGTLNISELTPKQFAHWWPYASPGFFFRTNTFNAEL